VVGTFQKASIQGRESSKYHVIFIPKYPRKVLYGELRRYLGEAFRRLARQKQIFAHFPTVAQVRPISKQFRLLDVAREGNGPRIPNRPPSRLSEIQPRLHPGRLRRLDERA
jgi:hypothetical protein